MAKQEFTYDQIISDLRINKYAPVYFLMGEEPYYIDVISDFIQNHTLDDAAKEFDQTILYGKDVDISTVINAAKRYPMMGGYQVLIVKEAQLIKEWDNIIHYLSNPLNNLQWLVVCFCLHLFC